MNQKNIILIGYRGCGKTTVGRILAERLNRTFVDSDGQIEYAEGLSIKEIFDRDGEAGFRRLEKSAIAEIVQRGNLVVSLGGGAILDPDNTERLKASGEVFWLTAPAEVLWRRIESDAKSAASRPNLTDDGGLKEVRRILAQREAAYQSAGHFRVDTASYNAAEVSTVIIGLLEDDVE